MRLLLLVAVLAVSTFTACSHDGVAAPSPSPQPGVEDRLNDRAWRALVSWSTNEMDRLKHRFTVDSGTVTCGDYKAEIGAAFNALQRQQGALDFWVQNVDVAGTAWQERFEGIRAMHEAHTKLLFRLMDLCEGKMAAH